MESFEKLARAVREITPHATTSLQGVVGEEIHFVCTVQVLSVILVRSNPGTYDDVIFEVSKKVDEIAHKIKILLNSV